MPVTPATTQTQLSHALAIRANGRSIGAVNEWNPSQNRGFTELYAFGTEGHQYGKGNGDPFELAPGNISGQQIAVRRYDLYASLMEDAFTNANPSLDMLSKQNDPLQLREQWASPDNANNRAYVYDGAWFSELGKSYSATGDRVVNTSATIMFTVKEVVPV